MRAKVDDACEIDAGDLAEALELAYPGESVGLTQEAVDGLPVGQREVLTKLYLVPDVLRVDAATVAASLGVTERNVRLREDESFSQLGVCVRAAGALAAGWRQVRGCSRGGGCDLAALPTRHGY